ncbi:MAG: pilus assembly protein [Devosia sp.]|nr:pilus assembly protein [Devosia sp.]
MRTQWLRKLLSPAIRRGRAFGRDEGGVTVVEFGILALPFFTIVTAILETSMIFLAGQILDSAVQDSARLIRTGQAQSSTPPYTPDDFRNAICDGLYGMFDCDPGDGRLRVNVSVIADFAAASTGYPLQIGDECEPEGCQWTLEDDYVPGTGGDVILVRAYYKWPTILNFPGFNFDTLPDGTRLLGAARVFKNEPFACSDCT